MPIILTKVINGNVIIHSIIINYAVINKAGYGKSL